MLFENWWSPGTKCAFVDRVRNDRSTSADRSDFTVSSPIPSTHVGIWACGSTWRRHTGKHGSSALHQPITQPTSWPHVASPTWSSTEQVARPATKQFHTSDWRALEMCCRPWTWWCNDVTALAGYATTMMMMIRRVNSLCVWWSKLSPVVVCLLCRGRFTWVAGLNSVMLCLLHRYPSEN